jgi:hypothetical protein
MTDWDIHFENNEEDGVHLPGGAPHMPAHLCRNGERFAFLATVEQCVAHASTHIKFGDTFRYISPSGTVLIEKVLCKENLQ